jgi:hypothetical protein
MCGCGAAGEGPSRSALPRAATSPRAAHAGALSEWTHDAGRAPLLRDRRGERQRRLALIPRRARPCRKPDPGSVGPRCSPHPLHRHETADHHRAEEREQPAPDRGTPRRTRVVHEREARDVRVIGKAHRLAPVDAAEEECAISRTSCCAQARSIRISTLRRHPSAPVATRRARSTPSIHRTRPSRRATRSSVRAMRPAVRPITASRRVDRGVRAPHRSARRWRPRPRDVRRRGYRSGWRSPGRGRDRVP